jgi:hypothetical protein
MSKLNCSQHGLAGMAFVCVHAAAAIDTGEPVGFYFDESEGPALAWCHACEQLRLQATETNPNVNWAAGLEFKSVCEQCSRLGTARLFSGSS